LDSDQGHVTLTTATNAEQWQAARISMKVIETTAVICSSPVLGYQQKMKRLVDDIDECWALCGKQQVSAGRDKDAVCAVGGNAFMSHLCWLIRNVGSLHSPFPRGRGEGRRVSQRAKCWMSEA